MKDDKPTPSPSPVTCRKCEGKDAECIFMGVRRCRYCGCNDPAAQPMGQPLVPPYEARLFAERARDCVDRTLDGYARSQMITYLADQFADVANIVRGDMVGVRTEQSKTSGPDSPALAKPAVPSATSCRPDGPEETGVLPPSDALHAACEELAVFGDYCGDWICKLCKAKTPGEPPAGYARKPFPHRESCVLHRTAKGKVAVGDAVYARGVVTRTDTQGDAEVCFGTVEGLVDPQTAWVPAENVERRMAEGKIATAPDVEGVSLQTWKAAIDVAAVKIRETLSKLRRGPQEPASETETETETENDSVWIDEWIRDYGGEKQLSTLQETLATLLRDVRKDERRRISSR